MKKYICQFKKADPNSRDGKKIMAIKLLRESAGCGLKQAKNVVDGKSAIMTETQVVNFIKYYCNSVHHGPGWGTPRVGTDLGLPVDSIYGLEWEVANYLASRDVITSTSWPTVREPTGYLFVVHREYDDLPF